jgi:hypothetical protein
MSLKKVRLAVAAIALIFIIAISGVSALTVSVAPDEIQPGDTVEIALAGLPDGSLFTLLIEGVFDVTPGAEFSFETKQFVMPFTLNDGIISASMQNTQYNVFSVKRNDTEARKVGSSVNGYFTTSTSGTIPSGEYDYITLGGTALPEALTVTAAMNLTGIKTGPEDSTLSFVADGITDGTVKVNVIVNGVKALTKTIIIGSPSTLTPTPTATSSGGYSGGGGGGYTSGSIGVPATSSSITAVPSTPVPNDTVIPESTYIAPAVTGTSGQDIPVTVQQTTEKSPSATTTPLGALGIPVAIALALALTMYNERRIRR